VLFAIGAVDFWQKILNVQNEELGETEIRITSDYGDHCHTEQVLKVQEVDIAYACRSAYSDSGEAIDENEEEESKPIVALRFK
jgi:hypothetical protein